MATSTRTRASGCRGWSRDSWTGTGPTTTIASGTTSTSRRARPPEPETELPRRSTDVAAAERDAAGAARPSLPQPSTNPVLCRVTVCSDDDEGMDVPRAACGLARAAAGACAAGGAVGRAAPGDGRRRRCRCRRARSAARTRRSKASPTAASATRPARAITAAAMPGLSQADRRPDRAEDGRPSRSQGRLRDAATRNTRARSRTCGGSIGRRSITPRKPGSRSRACTRSATTTCASCHKTRSFLKRDTGVPVVPRGPAQGRRSAATAPPATRRSWRSSRRASASTTRRARFALTGAHQRVACEKCHAENVFRGLRFDECSRCHKAPHRRTLGRTCTTCHTTERWAAAARASTTRRPASRSSAPTGPCRARTATSRASRRRSAPTGARRATPTCTARASRTIAASATPKRRSGRRRFDHRRAHRGSRSTRSTRRSRAASATRALPAADVPRTQQDAWTSAA